MNALAKDGERNPKSRIEKTEAESAALSGKLPDISALSDEDLSALVTNATTELAARRERRRTEFLANIREQARVLGIDPEEVARAFSRRARSGGEGHTTLPPKYRNPANTAETWSGRGVRPKWIQELLANGRKLEELLISPN